MGVARMVATGAQEDEMIAGGNLLTVWWRWL
jgi:hypothetical protein